MCSICDSLTSKQKHNVEIWMALCRQTQNDPDFMSRMRRANKSILLVFFDICGVVHSEFVFQGQTVSTKYYCDIVRLFKKTTETSYWKEVSGRRCHCKCECTTKTRLTQVLIMMIKQCKLEYFLTNVCARTCCVHITVQCSIYAQQEQLWITCFCLWRTNFLVFKLIYSQHHIPPACPVFLWNASQYKS